MNLRTLRMPAALVAACAGLLLIVGATHGLWPAASRPGLSPSAAIPSLSAVPPSAPVSTLAPSVSHTAVSAAEKKRTFTLDAATARIGDSTPRASAEGLFDRAFIPATGITAIRVTVPQLLAGEEVAISAPNGGKLERKNGALRFTPKTEGSADLDLAFEPTMGRGAYTITIRQAGALAVLDFWAGPTNPVGQPGPAYVPTASNDPASIP